MRFFQKTYLTKMITRASLLGVVVSIYSLYQTGPIFSRQLCGIGDLYCDVVHQGPYSEVFGFPVALIGILGYTSLFVLSRMLRRNEQSIILPILLIFISGAGLLFSIYLFLIQLFILSSWCWVCVFSLALISTCLVAAMMMWNLERPLTE